MTNVERQARSRCARRGSAPIIRTCRPDDHRSPPGADRTAEFDAVDALALRVLKRGILVEPDIRNYRAAEEIVGCRPWRRDALWQDRRIRRSS
jgi:hypothetical protein